MGKLVCFIGRVLWVLLILFFIYPMMFLLVFIFGTIWTFKPKQQWGYLMSMYREPISEQEFYSWNNMETYWIKKTFLDYILNRKTMIPNPNYDPEKEIRDNRKSMKVAYVSKEEAIDAVTKAIEDL